MNMRVRDFNSDYGDADFLAGERELNGARNFFSKQRQPRQKRIFQIENIIDFFFRNNKRVPGVYGTQIKKRQIIFVF